MCFELNLSPHLRQRYFPVLSNIFLLYFWRTYVPLTYSLIVFCFEVPIEYYNHALIRLQFCIWNFNLLRKFTCKINRKFNFRSEADKVCQNNNNFK